MSDRLPIRTDPLDDRKEVRTVKSGVPLTLFPAQPSSASGGDSEAQGVGFPSPPSAVQTVPATPPNGHWVHPQGRESKPRNRDGAVGSPD